MGLKYFCLNCETLQHNDRQCLKCQSKDHLVMMGVKIHIPKRPKKEDYFYIFNSLIAKAKSYNRDALIKLEKYLKNHKYGTHPYTDDRSFADYITNLKDNTRESSTSSFVGFDMDLSNNGWSSDHIKVDSRQGWTLPVIDIVNNRGFNSGQYKNIFKPIKRSSASTVFKSRKDAELLGVFFAKRYIESYDLYEIPEVLEMANIIKDRKDIMDVYPEYFI